MNEIREMYTIYSAISTLLQELSINHTILKMVCYVQTVCVQAVLKDKIRGPKEETFDMLEIML